MHPSSVEPAPQGIDLRRVTSQSDLAAFFRGTSVEAASGPIASQRRAYRAGVVYPMPAYKRPIPKSRLGRRATWCDSLFVYR